MPKPKAAPRVTAPAAVLILDPLARALASLKRALARSLSAPEDEELRDACIQRFEYTFELAWKMMRRRLIADGESPADVDALSKRALFRDAQKRGWIKNAVRWFGYLDGRNKTSQTYDTQVAAEVAAQAHLFARDAQALLAALRRAERAAQ